MRYGGTICEFWDSPFPRRSSVSNGLPIQTDGWGSGATFRGYATLLAGMKKYADIPVPALLFCGLPHGLGSWIDNSTDPKVRERAKAYTEALTALTERQAKMVEEGVPTAQVVRLPRAHHHVYLSNEADVLREMRSFLSRLP